MRECKTDWMPAIPVDMPFLTGSLLELLIENVAGELEAVLIESGGRLEPLVAMYNLSTLKFWEDCLLKDRLSIQRNIIKLNRKTILISDNDKSLVNLNSERDLNRVLSVLNGQMRCIQE